MDVISENTYRCTPAESRSRLGRPGSVVWWTPAAGDQADTEKTPYFQPTQNTYTHIPSDIVLP